MTPIEIQKDPFPSRHRVDTLVNPFLGYGTARDKVASGAFYASVPLSSGELHALYYGTDVAATIVDARPNEMFRRGYTMCSPAKEGDAAKLQKLGAKLSVDRKLKEAIVAGNLWGGALFIPGFIDSVADLTKPLVKERVRECRYINVVDRRFAHVDRWQTNPFLPGYGEPETYTISGQDTPPATIHASRVLRFTGVEPDQVTRRQVGGWGYSVLQRPYDTIKQFETAFASSGILLSDASQAVWKIQNLAELIASDREGLEARMMLTDMSRSAGRGVMIDAENEDFSRVATSFSGVDAMLDRFMMRLAAAARMPVTLLMGRSAAGMNATGDADFRAWYDSIASDQEQLLAPALEWFYDVLAAGKIEDLEAKFAPLWAPSASEVATTEKTRADTDKIYVDMGALHPEEVALARFGSGNGEIEIDEASLQKSLKQERKLMAEPTPEPVLGPDGLPLPPVPAVRPAVPTTSPDGDEEDPEKEPKSQPSREA